MQPASQEENESIALEQWMHMTAKENVFLSSCVNNRYQSPPSFCFSWLELDNWIFLGALWLDPMRTNISEYSEKREAGVNSWRLLVAGTVGFISVEHPLLGNLLPLHISVQRGVLYSSCCLDLAGDLGGRGEMGCVLSGGDCRVPLRAPGKQKVSVLLPPSTAGQGSE